jgi:hypothetical protein
MDLEGSCRPDIIEIPPRHLPGGTEANHEGISEYSRCLSRDSKRVRCEYELVALPLRQPARIIRMEAWVGERNVRACDDWRQDGNVAARDGHFFLLRRWELPTSCPWQQREEGGAIVKQVRLLKRRSQIQNVLKLHVEQTQSASPEGIMSYSHDLGVSLYTGYGLQIGFIDTHVHTTQNYK